MKPLILVALAILVALGYYATLPQPLPNWCDGSQDCQPLTAGDITL